MYITRLTDFYFLFRDYKVWNSDGCLYATISVKQNLDTISPGLADLILLCTGFSFHSNTLKHKVNGEYFHHHV